MSDETQQEQIRRIAKYVKVHGRMCLDVERYPAAEVFDLAGKVGEALGWEVDVHEVEVDGRDFLEIRPVRPEDPNELAADAIEALSEAAARVEDLGFSRMGDNLMDMTGRVLEEAPGADYESVQAILERRDREED